MTDPAQSLAALASRSPRVELGPAEVYVLAFLHLRALREGLAAFEEDAIFDAYEQAIAAVGEEPRSGRGPAGHALRRLREQQMLTRVDRAGVARAGSYALTRLATGIAEFFVEEDVLTRESLTLLLDAVRQTLGQVLERAERASSTAQWRQEVEAPLRVTVSDLVRGIERRQRGLDIQQAAFQDEIAGLLAADWFGAVGRCQALLDTTAATLRELNAVVLGQVHPLQALLLDLRGRSGVPEAEPARAVIDRLVDQVDRIAAWSAARQQSWGEYYEYIHRYLRDVVRLDPSRAIAHRLREQLAGHAARPFSLVVAGQPAVVELREVEPREAPPPVRRPRAEREREPRPETPEEADLAATLEDWVSERLRAGVRELSALTAELTASCDPSQRFLLAGRVAAIFAKLVRAESEHERPWVQVDPQLEIEDWHRRAEDDEPA